MPDVRAVTGSTFHWLADTIDFWTLVEQSIVKNFCKAFGSLIRVRENSQQDDPYSHDQSLAIIFMKNT